MRLHYSFFVFFLLFFTAASQAFSADPDNASAPSGPVVESTNNDSGVTLSVQGPVVVDYDWTGPYRSDPADIAAVRRYRSRGGIGINVEQQVLTDLGLFARAGLASGNTEPYEFTDIDRTIAAGLSLSGKLWTRPDDTVGIASLVNGISMAHRAFLNGGGLGILIGDGKLPHPSREYIVEANYNVHIWREISATIDLQRIVNPAHNRDRGPVWIPGFRLHAEF
jgi:high affinity Mn2+ porin